jgi:hypothetical protein
MIKVSITLPNSVQITLESDSEIVHEILETVLKDLPKELLSGGPPVLGGPSLNESDQLNISQISDVLSRLQVLLPDQNAVQSSLPEGVAPTNGAANLPSVPGNPTPVPANPTEDNVSSAAPENSSYHQEAVSGLPAEASKDSFIQFCRSLNPLGDMRKVVVAAEGAEQFLRADGVDAEELSRLFELAGWTQPHSFNQTLRNAARSKFRWIERMPGRNGRYGVTDRGKEIARQG